MMSEESLYYFWITFLLLSIIGQKWFLEGNSRGDSELLQDRCDCLQRDLISSQDEVPFGNKPIHQMAISSCFISNFHPFAFVKFFCSSSREYGITSTVLKECIQCSLNCLLINFKKSSDCCFVRSSITVLLDEFYNTCPIMFCQLSIMDGHH